MTYPVKFNKHIVSIERPGPVENTRFGKIRLDKNERISPFPNEFWRKALEEISQEIVQACPETWPLYKKLADFHEIDMGQIILTAGSETAIRNCIEAFVPPGGKVFYPDPTFAMVPVYCDLYNAAKCPVEYDKNLKLKVDFLLRSIADDTYLIILANPNSPTGTYIPNRIIEGIIERASVFRIPVLIDEAYYGFCRYTAFDLIKKYPNLIITRSFSKITGMAGLRVGYAIGHPDVISLLTKFRSMYEVNSIGIAFALKILDNWYVAEEYGRETVEGREFFSNFLKRNGFTVIDTETNFIHVDFGSLKEKILTILEENDVLVRGMLNIDGYRNYTRFSVGPRSMMEPVATIIYNAVENKLV
jgi:histidinol-phosphate aminotransferase